MDDDGADVQSNIDEAIIGDLAAQITSLKDLMKKKFDKMEISQHEKRNVMEAKLKKLIKDNESKF